VISAQMRDVLIEHLDGRPVPIILIWNARSTAESARIHHRSRTVGSLIERGLLRTNRVGSRLRPTHTILTDDGREQLAAALGDWADALSRVRWATNVRPMDIAAG
jgi:hypothetical protein